jgi:hypothetical protein
VPGARSYELVSPAEKNGGGALSGDGAYGLPSPDGEAFQFNTTSLFGDPPGVQAYLSAPYVSRRGEEGWRTMSVSPPFCGKDIDDIYGPPVVQPYYLFSEDLRKLAFTHPESGSCALPPLDPSAPLPQSNLYLTDLSEQSSAYTLIAPAPGPVLRSYAMPSGLPYSFSADDSTIIYNSSGQQTSDAPVLIESEERAAPSVFAWDDRSRALRLISRDREGKPITGGAVVAGTGYRAQSPVSADGDRVFVQSPSYGEGCSVAPSSTCYRLWMREGDSTSYLISEPECDGACDSEHPVVFQGASRDGTRVLMRSEASLTDEDQPGDDLFRYRHSADPGGDRNLTRLTTDEELADGSESGYEGTVAISEDLDVVYFAASGQLLAGRPLEPGPKLYRWSEGGGLQFLALLDPADSPVWQGFADFYKLAVPRQATPDGRFLAIRTLRPLESGIDTDSGRDLYRWSADTGWLCASCRPGVSSASDVRGLEQSGTAPLSQITPDGGRLFFATKDALHPKDVNEASDVYEWHVGVIVLVSPGSGPHSASLLGLGAGGRDVFFYTDQRLVGSDLDYSGDIYDARISGGFPEPEPPLEPCLAAPCRLRASGIPASPSAGTGAFHGRGNLRQKCRHRRNPGKRKQACRGGKRGTDHKPRPRKHRGGRREQ